MSNILANTEDPIMDDTNVELKANSKENEDDDHIKLQEDQHLEQSSIENTNQDVLSISSENNATSNSTSISAKEDVSSILSKREDLIDGTSIKVGANTNEENKEKYDSKLQEDTNSEHSTVEKEQNVSTIDKENYDSKLQEDTNSEHSTVEKEQNVSTIDKEKITIPENITSKSTTTVREQLLCSVNSCSDSDSDTEVSFKVESKVMSNNSSNAEDTSNDLSRKLEIRFEEKNESDDNNKLIEDVKSRHSPGKSQPNDSIISIEPKSSPENIATELTSTKGKQLLCSAYADSNSDSEISLQDDNKGIFCSMYSDSESEGSIEKEKNENDFIKEHQSQGSDKALLKYEPKILKDSQNSGTDLKKLSILTELNGKETGEKINLESNLSALSNKKVEFEHSNEEQEVQNQNFNVLQNLVDSCSEPIYKHNSNNLSSEMQDLSKNVDTDIDMSYLFEPNEDSRSNSFATQTEEKCENSVTEQLYKEFSKIIEDEDKESKVPENVTENKIDKTITPNLDNIIFRDFSINLTNLESTLGCKPVEMLQDIDVSLSEWATLLVSQLSIRDELISTLYSSIEKLVQKGTILEQDLDYQQIKITELKQQVKKKKRKHKHKSCQTDQEEQLNSWKEYYEAYPHSYAQYFYQNNQWPADYGAKTSVVNSSVAQTSSKKKVPVVRDHIDDKVVDDYKDFMKNVKNNISVQSVTKDLSTNESSEELDIKNEENVVKVQDDKNNKNQTSSETKETTEIDIIQTKNTSISKSTNAVNSSISGNKSDEIIQTLIDEAQDHQTDDSISQIVTEDITESDSHGWDSSKSISDQVVAAASQIVEGSGYVFDQESGLYYDHNSGYYYNAETGLYYDSNSGTYFYYDHTTQAYQFHSQVTPEDYENTTKSGNKRKIKSLEDAHIPENGLNYDSNSGTYFYYDHTTQAYWFQSQIIPKNYEWMKNDFYYESKIGTIYDYDYTSQAYAEWNENGLYYESNVDHTSQANMEWKENALYHESNIYPTSKALYHESNIYHTSKAYEEWKERQNGLNYESNIDHTSQANEERKDNALYYESNIDHTRQANEERKENALYYESNIDHTSQAYEEWKENGLDYESNIGTYFDYDYTSPAYDKLTENGLSYDSSSGIYFNYDQTNQAYMFQSQIIPKKSENTTRETNKRKIVNHDILKEEENMSGEEHIPLKKKKLKNENETNEEKEDGECSESEEFSDGLDGVYGLNELSNEESEEDMEKDDEEVPISQSEVPPSLRLMVIQSEAKKVSVGSLQMVTVDGGTAGRESSNIVHLQDISVSKVHARFIFRSNGPSDFHYYVQDLGSNNGTFVNAKRLSEPRQESEEKELGHGWLLRLGQLTLKCHIHPGNLTCNECEPGLVAKVKKKKEGSGYKSVKSREKARKKEMKAIKKKYALSYTDQSSLLGSEYKDRAENRRLVVGSDNPYEKTEVASTETALTSKNKGFKMLEKMGWTEGHGIGKTTGLIEPIQPESSVGRSGLGSMVTPVPETTSDQANRKKIIAITQKRYNKL